MSEKATIEPYVNYILNKITTHDVEQVSERLRALGWEEVVRCRDCKHAFEAERGLFDCIGPLTTSWDYQHDDYKENLVDPGGFCAWGERRDA